jgi:CHAD domain-containing protein
VAPFADELRWLGGALGPARDWDVFMTETLPPLARRFRQMQGLASFRARAARARRAHDAAAREAVASGRYTDLVLALGEAFARDDLPAFATGGTPRGVAGDAGEPLPRFDAPVGAFAAYALERRHRRVRKRGRGVPEVTPEERHRVRIAAKKLRYAAEFFRSLYPAKRVARYVGALEDLQDILGALNDAAVVDRLLAEVSQGGKPIAAGVDGLVRGWVAAVAQHELARYARAWDEFKDAKPFWR